MQICTWPAWNLESGPEAVFKSPSADFLQELGVFLKRNMLFHNCGLPGGEKLTQGPRASTLEHEVPLWGVQKQ